MANFTIGCDPELFVKNRGEFISAYGLVPGTKDEPFDVAEGAIQVDGMALEFNVDPCALNYLAFDRFNYRIETVLNQLKAKVQQKYPNAYLAKESVAVFGKEYMAKQPADALMLGCDPDYNAYTLEQNPRPDGEVDFRGAGGHIHIGWAEGIPVDNQEHLEICANFIKYMDATVGLASLCMDRDHRRREMYGQAGAFRPKSYGVEYRTPSNTWIKTVSARRVIYRLTSTATTLAIRNVEPISYYSGGCWHRPTFEDIAAVINTGDHRTAIEWLKNASDSYVWHSCGAWFGDLNRIYKREYKDQLAGEV